MPTEIFTVLFDGTNTALSGSAVINPQTPADQLEDMGDEGTIAGPDGRRCWAGVYDLNQFGGIPENAVVTDVKFTVTPTQTKIGPTAGDVDHRFALMASTGGWNRSKQDALHADISGIVYGNPSRREVISVRGFDAASVELFSTLQAITSSGFHVISTSSVWPTFGTTFLLPANKTLKTVSFFIQRLDAATSALISASVYELESDARRFAIKSLIKTTQTVDYSTIGGSLSLVGFDFSDAGIASDPSPRWLGVVLGGEWFTSGKSVSANRLLTFADSVDTDGIYAVLSEGSFFTAKLVSASEKDNSLSAVAFPYESDVPHIYQNSITTPLTAPFQRYKGNVLASSDSAVTWTASTPYNYGSPASGQLNVISGIVAEFQSHLDGVDYDLASGKTFLGILFEPNDPDEFLWESASSTHATIAAPTLTLTWNEPPVITSVPPAGFFLPNNLFSYDVEATDIDLDTLIFSLQTNPSGMVINSSSGLITWTPIPGQEGSNSVTVRATDPGGLFDEQTFSVQVILIGTAGCPEVDFGTEAAVNLVVSSRQAVSVGVISREATELDIEDCP